MRGDELEPVKIQAAAFVVDDFDRVIAFFQIKNRWLLICGRIEFFEIVFAVVAPSARVREEEGAIIFSIDLYDTADAVDDTATCFELKKIRTVLRDGDLPSEAMSIMFMYTHSTPSDDSSSMISAGSRSSGV